MGGEHRGPAGVLVGGRAQGREGRAGQHAAVDSGGTAYAARGHALYAVARKNEATRGEEG